MKTETRQLLRDLQAAVILGRPEAVDIALDGLLKLPEVPANQRMSDGFITQVVLPVGEALAGLKSPQLRPLLKHKLAVGRAIGGVALAHRFIKGHDATQNDLRDLGCDARSDVRTALGRSLAHLSTVDPGKITHLGSIWITGTAPRLRHTALVFLPVLAPEIKNQLLGMLGPLNTEEDMEVNAALVEALNLLSQKGCAESVLDILRLWSTAPQPNSWVICRVLSASWVFDHIPEVKSILQAVYAKTGETRSITNALKALARHGIEIHLEGLSAQNGKEA